MSKTITATDRSRLIRLASSMPAGSPKRKAILNAIASTDQTDFLDTRLDRAWKKALKSYFAWKQDGEKTDSRLYQQLRQDPTNERANSTMLELLAQYRKEGGKLLKTVKAIYAAAEGHPISKQSDFRQGKGNLDHAEHGLKSFTPSKYDNPVDMMYHGSYGYQMLMSAIEHLAYARHSEGLKTASTRTRTAKYNTKLRATDRF